MDDFNSDYFGKTIAMRLFLIVTNYKYNKRKHRYKPKPMYSKVVLFLLIYIRKRDRSSLAIEFSLS
jgi:hypothetical protein